jgi:hypothetical protein
MMKAMSSVDVGPVVSIWKKHIIRLIMCGFVNKLSLLSDY